MWITGRASPLDFVVLGYLFWGWFRGRWRGIGKELHGLIRLVLLAVLVLGFSVFSWVRKGFSGVAENIPPLSGFGGAILILLAAFLVMFLLRNLFGPLIEARLSPMAVKRYGGIVGLLRTALVVFLVLGLLGALPLGPISRAAAEDSITGRAAHWLYTRAEHLVPSGTTGTEAP